MKFDSHSLFLIRFRVHLSLHILKYSKSGLKSERKTIYSFIITSRLNLSPFTKDFRVLVILRVKLHF